MLSRPDFLEKQLFVVYSSQVRHLRFANENIVIEEDSKIIQQVSLHKTLAIMVYGECTISTRLMVQCQSFHVPLILLKQNMTHIVTIDSGMG
jgi:CRISPR/Cas system-associated endonuclease Cas1